MPEIKFHKKLLGELELLKKKFPKIGICCFGMPLDDAIAIFNTAGIPMQFKPKSVEDMRKIRAGIKSGGEQASIHLPNLRFDEAGHILRKEELMAMIKEKTPKGLQIITIHPGWKDVDLIMDKEDNWKNSGLAEKVKNDLAEIFSAGILSGKVMTLENLRFKPWKHQFRELFGSRTEHLRNARETLIAAVAKKTGISLSELRKKSGFTLDAGHASGNAHLKEKYTLRVWLRDLGKDIKILHLHDMRPEIEEEIKIEKDHLPVGDGVVDWKRFLKNKEKYCPDAPMIIELSEEDAIKSVDYLLRLK